jgi:hypothetical protein
MLTDDIVEDVGLRSKHGGSLSGSFAGSAGRLETARALQTAEAA